MLASPAAVEALAGALAELHPLSRKHQRLFLALDDAHLDLNLGPPISRASLSAGHSVGHSAGASEAAPPAALAAAQSPGAFRDFVRLCGGSAAAPPAPLPTVLLSSQQRSGPGLLRVELVGGALEGAAGEAVQGVYTQDGTADGAPRFSNQRGFEIFRARVALVGPIAVPTSRVSLDVAKGGAEGGRAKGDTATGGGAQVLVASGAPKEEGRDGEHDGGGSGESSNEADLDAPLDPTRDPTRAAGCPVVVEWLACSRWFLGSRHARRAYYSAPSAVADGNQPMTPHGGSEGPWAPCDLPPAEGWVPMAGEGRATFPAPTLRPTPCEGGGCSRADSSSQGLGDAAVGEGPHQGVAASFAPWPQAKAPPPGGQPPPLPPPEDSSEMGGAGGQGAGGQGVEAAAEATAEAAAEADAPGAQVLPASAAAPSADAARGGGLGAGRPHRWRRRRARVATVVGGSEGLAPQSWAELGSWPPPPPRGGWAGLAGTIGPSPDAPALEPSGAVPALELSARDQEALARRWLSAGLWEGEWPSAFPPGGGDALARAEAEVCAPPASLFENHSYQELLEAARADLAAFAAAAEAEAGPALAARAEAHTHRRAVFVDRRFSYAAAVEEVAGQVPRRCQSLNAPPWDVLVSTGARGRVSAPEAALGAYCVVWQSHLVIFVTLCPHCLPHLQREALLEATGRSAGSPGVGGLPVSDLPSAAFVAVAVDRAEVRVLGSVGHFRGGPLQRSK